MIDKSKFKRQQQQLNFADDKGDDAMTNGNR